MGAQTPSLPVFERTQIFIYTIAADAALRNIIAGTVLSPVHLSIFCVLEWLLLWIAQSFPNGLFLAILSNKNQICKKHRFMVSLASNEK